MHPAHGVCCVVELGLYYVPPKNADLSNSKFFSSAGGSSWNLCLVLLAFSGLLETVHSKISQRFRQSYMKKMRPPFRSFLFLGLSPSLSSCCSWTELCLLFLQPVRLKFLTWVLATHCYWLEPAFRWKALKYGKLT